MEGGDVPQDIQLGNSRTTAHPTEHATISFSSWGQKAAETPFKVSQRLGFWVTSPRLQSFWEMRWSGYTVS